MSDALDFVVLSVSGLGNCLQQGGIEYLRAENAVARERLGDGRLLLSDGQRRRPAMHGERRQRLGGMLNYYHRAGA